VSDDGEMEIYRTLRDTQSRYVYFLLGVAGAAIAFAVTQTREAALSWSQVPLGAAVVLWAASFYAGCRNIVWVTAGLRANAELLDVNAGRSKITGTNLQAIHAAREQLHGIFEEHSARANSNYRRQFRFLVAGAVAYVGWHVLEMYLRAVA